MELFTLIEDAHAILRLPKGVQKQVKLYRRGLRVYVPHGGGYVEVRGTASTSQPSTNGAHSTSHPDVNVLDFEMTERHQWHLEKDNAGQTCLRMVK